MLFLHVLAHENFQQAANLAMLLGLRIDPVADHLLLGAHVVDQPLNGLGQIGHGGGGRSARPALADRLFQPLDGAAQEIRGGKEEMSALVAELKKSRFDMEDKAAMAAAELSRVLR